MANNDQTAKQPLAAIAGAPPPVLVPLDKAAASACSADILERMSDSEIPVVAACREALRSDRQALAFLGNAFSLSSYLRDCALIQPAILAEVLSLPIEEGVKADIGYTRELWRSAASESALMAALRRMKKKVALALGLGDLGGWLEPATVTRLLSDFAEACLKTTCDYLLKGIHESGKIVLDDPEHPSADSGIILLAMGKFGAWELNYSSDIDIILFFDLSAKMQLQTDDPTSLFVRFAKQLSRMLQERTGDGYVFRVDLRLRPDPGSTPLAIPVETAFNYYEAYGQNWERAAFIKARAVAGDIPCGEAFLAELAPFVWRKYLDFAAIQDVHSIKRQIHVHKGHGEIAVKGHNVKLGRGGIREIEFFVQTQQLIAGGRRSHLRTRGTIASLEALRDDGWIGSEAAEKLTTAYWFLRKVEHRIQMVADEQSHTLPEDDEGLARIAAMMGHADSQAFADELVATMRQVETHYAALFEASPELAAESGNLVFTGEDDDPQTLETISRMGFQQPSQIISTVRGWHYGRYAAVRSSQAREILTELTPFLIEAFSETGQPDQAFFAFDRFLAGLPAGLQFFSILKSNDNLVRLLVLILGSAPRLCDIITRKPHVFDGLIDPSFGASVPTREQLAERLQLVLARLDAYESRLDQARVFAAEQKFLIGIRLMNRTITARQAGLALTDLAEVLLSALLNLARSEFERQHGKIPGGEIAILGMGRLGSADLTAGSDLDLIFLYDHPEDAEASDGPKPLYAQQYFTRFVQRLITAMSAPTAEGVVYELDFRLRPSGNAGPLATNIHSFSKYQREEAWTWERQALVRARPVAGDKVLVERVEKEIAEILALLMDRKKIRKEIAEMRETLRQEKPAKNGFDVKMLDGGMIDIEFITQWTRLAGIADSSSGQQTPAILSAADEETLPVAQKELLLQAYEFFNSVLQIQRVCLEGDFDPQDAEKGFIRVLAEQVSQPDLRAVEAELARYAKAVSAIFRKLIG